MDHEFIAISYKKHRKYFQNILDKIHKIPENNSNSNSNSNRKCTLIARFSKFGTRNTRNAICIQVQPQL
jgi:hypothetical protein